METFEFVVTSIARVALKEYELIDYESTEDIMDWEDTAEYKLNSEESLWTSEY